MKKIVLIGMKACGKSTVGKLLSNKLDLSFIELDNEVIAEHFERKKENVTSREIYNNYGMDYFREIEEVSLNKLKNKIKNKNFVLACGGGTPLKKNNRKILKGIGTIFFLDVKKDIILKRIFKNGIPSFFAYKDDPGKSLMILLKERLPIYSSIADFKLKLNNETPKQIVKNIISLLDVSNNRYIE